MSNDRHPRSRARRRELDKQHKAPRDAFGAVISTKDPYEPRDLSTPYCPSSHSEKMQFETEREALLFIAYNAERIAQQKGKAPIRAYYCKACGCWHITSKEKRAYTNIRSNKINGVA